MLEELGIQAGRVALYGKAEAGAAYAVFSDLEKAMPGLSIVGQMDDSLLMQAMATKDEQRDRAHAAAWGRSPPPWWVR